MRSNIVKDLFPTTLQDLQNSSKDSYTYSFTDVHPSKNIYLVHEAKKIIAMPDYAVHQLEQVCPAAYLSFALNTITGFMFIYGNLERDDISELVVDSAMKSLGLKRGDFTEAVDALAQLYLDITSAIDIDNEWRTSAREYLQARELFKQHGGKDPGAVILEVWDTTLKNECYDYLRCSNSHLSGRLMQTSVSYRPSQVLVISCPLATVVTASNYLFSIGTNYYRSYTGFNAIANHLSRDMGADSVINLTIAHLTVHYKKPMIGSLVTRMDGFRVGKNVLFGSNIIDMMFNKNSCAGVPFLDGLIHYGDYCSLFMGAKIKVNGDDLASDDDVDAEDISYSTYALHRFSVNKEVVAHPDMISVTILMSAIQSIASFTKLDLRTLYRRNILQKFLSEVHQQLCEAIELQKQLFSLQYRRIVKPEYRCVTERDYDEVIALVSQGNASQLLSDKDMSLMELVLLRLKWDDAPKSYRTVVQDTDGGSAILDIYFGSTYTASDELQSIMISLSKIGKKAADKISKMF